MSTPEVSGREIPPRLRGGFGSPVSEKPLAGAVGRLQLFGQMRPEDNF